MWQQEFTWFFTIFHQEFRKKDPIAFEVLMVLALAHSTRSQGGGDCRVRGQFSLRF